VAPLPSPVQVGYPANDESRSLPIRTIAICAGSGGSMLVGKQADVYLTGEMSHVGPSTFTRRSFI